MPSPSDRTSLRATHKSSRPSPLALPPGTSAPGFFWPNWGPLPCNQSHGERERGMDLLHPPMDLWVDKVWVLGDKIVSGFFLAIALGAIKSWSLQTCSSFKEHHEKLKGLVCQLVSGISFRSICLSTSVAPARTRTHHRAFLFSSKETNPTYLPPVIDLVLTKKNVNNGAWLLTDRVLGQ